MLPSPPEPKVSARGGDHIEAVQLLSARSENAHEAGPFGLSAVRRIEPREAGEDPNAIIDWLLRKGAHRER
jgi:hypothetical protein